MRVGSRAARQGLHPLLASICSVALTCWVTACTSQPAVDRSLLTDTPCAAPCWSSMLPGESSEAEVFEALVASPWVRKGSVSAMATEERGVALRMVSWHARGDKVGRIYLRDDEVLRIDLELAQGPTFGEVVAKYGPPEGIRAQVGGVEARGFLIVLDYPSRGLSVETFGYLGRSSRVTADDTSIAVREDLRVTGISYYQPGSLTDVLQRAFGYSPSDAEAVVGDEQPWNGFGRVTYALSWAASPFFPHVSGMCLCGHASEHVLC